MFLRDIKNWQQIPKHMKYFKRSKVSRVYIIIHTQVSYTYLLLIVKKYFEHNDNWYVSKVIKRETQWIHVSPS